MGKIIKNLSNNNVSILFSVSINDDDVTKLLNNQNIVIYTHMVIIQNNNDNKHIYNRYENYIDFYNYCTQTIEQYNLIIDDTFNSDIYNQIMEIGRKEEEESKNIDTVRKCVELLHKLCIMPQKEVIVKYGTEWETIQESIKDVYLSCFNFNSQETTLVYCSETKNNRYIGRKALFEIARDGIVVIPIHDKIGKITLDE